MVGNPQTDKPELFQTGLLAQRRDRAHGLGFVGGADFLHRAVMESVTDRLASVTRSFTNCTLLGVGSGRVESLLPSGAETNFLERSNRRAVQVGAAPTDYAETLPLMPDSQDLILSLLELHWADDPVGQLIQMRRALRPDGLAIVTLFGGQTLHELRTSLAEAESRLSGGLSPRIAPMAELRDLGALLQRAGFALPVADSERVDVTYTDIWALMRDLRAMGETNILAGRLRKPTPRGLFELADQVYRQNFPADEERIRATFEIVYLTGWAPADTQPQPLRPGSAKMRLADALGTTEIPAGDQAAPRKMR